MITRLKVDGFKNLVDVDVHFGAFNVITGANGVGKSNLFDLIELISRLSQMPIRIAFGEIRNGAKSYRDVFRKSASNGKIDLRITIEFDSYNTESKEKYTSIKSVSEYEIIFFLNEKNAKLPILHKERLFSGGNEIFLASESELRIIDDEGKSIVVKNLGGYEDSVIYSAGNFSNHIKSAKNQIGNWNIFNLNRNSIRTRSIIGDDLYLDRGIINLSLMIYNMLYPVEGDSKNIIYKKISNRLFELTGEINDIRLHESEGDNEIWIEFCGNDGVWHNAQALSDGTLYFLSLVILEMHSTIQGVFCIEEPENGIHPSRVPALMQLLQDIAKAPNRQVIINTHSPLITSLTPEDSLIIVTPVHAIDEQNREFVKPKFCGLKGTWREKVMPTASVSALRPFLDVAPVEEKHYGAKRIVDRDDVKRLLRRFQEREAES